MVRVWRRNGDRLCRVNVLAQNLGLSDANRDSSNLESFRNDTAATGIETRASIVDKEGKQFIAEFRLSVEGAQTTSR